MSLESESAGQKADTLRWARGWVLVLLLWPLMLVSAIGVDLWVLGGRRDREAMQWMARLDPTVPALRPSGTLQRHPEMALPGIDLRLTPLFGLTVDGWLPPPDGGCLWEAGAQ